MGRSLRASLADALEGGLLPWKAEKALAREFRSSPREIEAAALEAGMRLERYARNFRTIDVEGQFRLHRSRVLVAGCGGLGGYLVEELARLGVGAIVAVDPDVFDASNLNRQLFSSLDELGRAKVEVASARVARINPALILEAHAERLSASNAEALLAGAHCAADALDSIPDRLMLERACGVSDIPLVHAAIAGHYVQATTVLPGSGSLAGLYGKDSPPRGIESELGNPAFTPAIAASIEVAEIVRILLGQAPALAGILFHLDLERMESVRLPLA